MAEVTYRIVIESGSGGTSGTRASASGGSASGEGGTPTSLMGVFNSSVTNKMSAETYALFEVGQSVGKTLLNYAQSNIATYTGNSVLQARVNNQLQMIGYAAQIAVNPLLGLASVATNIGLQAINNAWERKWENRSAAENQRRSGNYLSNGSRK